MLVLQIGLSCMQSPSPCSSAGAINSLHSDADGLCLGEPQNCNFAMLTPKSGSGDRCKRPPSVHRWWNGSVSFSPWWWQLTWKQLLLLHIIIVPHSGLPNVKNICFPESISSISRNCIKTSSWEIILSEPTNWLFCIVSVQAQHVTNMRSNWGQELV